MGFAKNIYIETIEELERIASSADGDDIAAVTAYLKGESGSTRGVISPTFESNLDVDLDAYLEDWMRLLRDEEDEHGPSTWFI